MEQLTKRLYERVLGAEMTHYLGYEKGQAPTGDQPRENHRNGRSKKKIVSEEGKLEIEVPRDRVGEFETQFIRKGQRRFGGFDSKIIAMYAQGMTVREIKAFLEAVQGGGISRADQYGNRFRYGGCGRMAEPATGEDVSGSG
jgi:transposase-like protein